MMRKTILLVMGLLFLMNLVSAADLSISPAKLDLDNLLRDGYAERVIKIRSFSEEEFGVILAWANGTMSDWVSVYTSDGEPFELNVSHPISASNPIILKVIIQPPSDLSNGDYKGVLFARSNYEKDTSLLTGSSLQVAVALVFNLGISDDEVIACRAEINEIEDIAFGSTAFLPIRVYNDGNVEFPPKVKIDVWDYVRQTKHKSIVFDSFRIKPTVNDLFTIPIDLSDVVTGQYFVDVKVVECGVEKELTFDILDEENLQCTGEITNTYTPVRSIVTDPVLFYIDFENTGEQSYKAKFKGSVWVDDDIQELVESEELYVKKGETINFEVPFVSKKIGFHELKGQVYYANKRTFEKIITLKVFPESMREEIEAIKTPSYEKPLTDSSKGFNYSYALIFIIVILVLLIMIKRAKKS